jgi:hypothetical protein
MSVVQRIRKPEKDASASRTRSTSEPGVQEIETQETARQSPLVNTFTAAAWFVLEKVVEKQLRDLGATDVDLFRGRAIRIEAPAAVFAKLKSPESMQGLPAVCHLDVTAAKDNFAAFLNSPLLTRAFSLNLSGNGLTDDHATQLASCKRLINLRWLSLADNEIDKRGVQALAKATVNADGALHNLQYLELAGNYVNPIARFIFDHSTILDSVLPQEGLDIEEEAGHPVPWLHRDFMGGHELVKNRYLLGAAQVTP